MKKLSNTRCPKTTKFLADENISAQTIKLLREIGYDIKAVAESTSKGHEDDEIVGIAEPENRVITTHDVGFGSIYYFSKRGQAGIILIRIHPPTIEEVNPILVDFSEQSKLGKENSD